MKQKKYFKSLAELSADSIGPEHTDAEKMKPQEPQAFAKATSNIPPETRVRAHDLHRYHNWGINE
jgi:hypothetical protein